jgi:hypothetical protein
MRNIVFLIFTLSSSLHLHGNSLTEHFFEWRTFVLSNFPTHAPPQEFQSLNDPINVGQFIGFIELGYIKREVSESNWKAKKFIEKKIGHLAYIMYTSSSNFFKHQKKDPTDSFFQNMCLIFRNILTTIIEQSKTSLMDKLKSNDHGISSSDHLAWISNSHGLIIFPYTLSASTHGFVWLPHIYETTSSRILAQHGKIIEQAGLFFDKKENNVYGVTFYKGKEGQYECKTYSNTTMTGTENYYFMTWPLSTRLNNLFMLEFCDFLIVQPLFGFQNYILNLLSSDDSTFIKKPYYRALITENYPEKKVEILLRNPKFMKEIDDTAKNIYGPFIAAIWSILCQNFQSDEFKEKIEPSTCSANFIINLFLFYLKNEEI